MHPRFAALLFALGLADLAYANLRLAPEVLAATARGSSALREPDSDDGAGASARAPSAPARSSRRSQASALAPGPSSVVSALFAASEVADTRAPPSEVGTRWVVPFPAPNSADLTLAAEEDLMRLAARLRAHPDWRIGIVGHTDARGERDYNRDLGRQRARVVADALALAGVSPEQLETRSGGEEEPKVPGFGEDAWARNRRVEIAISTQGSRAP